MRAYRSVYGGITFSRAEGIAGGTIPLSLPCGQCVGCRLERSRQWAIRCVHEASLHDANSFSTLTYDDEHLPYHFGLVKRDFQLFMKRLRKHFHPLRIRFYHVGEYGDKFKRPHYHALLFGLDFDDKVIFSRSKAGVLYTSDVLSKIWGKGFVTVGALTFESAAYCARYCMKKVNGDQADAHYLRIDEDTGECFKVIPEYSTMSNHPGIAHDWIAAYTEDVYPSDFLTLKGRKLRPPKYYDRYFEHLAPDAMAQIKEDRESRARELNLAAESTPERLEVREVCSKARLSGLKRSYESGD